MERKLLDLYTLQTLDDELDKLEEDKGDLPAEIRSLEEKVEEMTTQRNARDQVMKSSFANRDKADSDIISLKEKVERYKAQQMKVRNNREYDALTKEMDTAVETIVKLEKDMETLEITATTARNEIEELDGQIAEMTGTLDQKRGSLGEISQANMEQETTFRKERGKVAGKLGKGELNAYERIRKAKRGKAVVPVTREACGGCFAKVPRQGLLELKQNNRLYTCEHCGRILVSEEIRLKVTPVQ